MKNKIFILILSAFSVTFLSGCQSSQERIDDINSTITQYQDYKGVIDEQIQTVSDTIPALQQSLNDPNLPDALRQQAADALNKAQAQLQNFIAAKTKVDDAISKLQTAIVKIKQAGDVDWTGELGVYAQGAILISQLLPPPISGYVALGATIATIISQIMRKRDKKENTQLKQDKAATEKKLDEVVTAQSIAADMSPEAAAAITKANDKVLTAPTVATVTKILAS